jgi:hypothetical protein
LSNAAAAEVEARLPPGAGVSTGADLVVRARRRRAAEPDVERLERGWGRPAQVDVQVGGAAIGQRHERCRVARQRRDCKGQAPHRLGLGADATRERRQPPRQRLRLAPAAGVAAGVAAGPAAGRAAGSAAVAAAGAAAGAADRLVDLGDRACDVKRGADHRLEHSSGGGGGRAGAAL